MSYAPCWHPSSLDARITMQAQHRLSRQVLPIRTLLRPPINGLVHEPANVSRGDLFVDFCADLTMDSFDPLQSWITRTQSIDMHYRYNKFSGWSFGMGGEIGARLYDKTLEVEKKSKKFYLHDFWKAEGWDGQQTVWRMEFEAKREVLKQLSIYKVSNLLELQSALWLYLTQDWLRLAIPSPTDSNQTR